MTRILFSDKLDNCVAKWRSAGMTVIGPVQGESLSSYAAVEKAGDLSFGMVLPDRSLKELFFPQTEPMLRYTIKKNEIETADFTPPAAPRIIFGARPCDASGLAIDDPLFGWDYKDEYWFQRRNESVIVTIACTKADDFCMCTSLKQAPDCTKGSDVLLRPLDNNRGWVVEELTDRGREAFTLISEHIKESDETALPTVEVPEKFNLDTCVAWLQNPDNFDSKFWERDFHALYRLRFVHLPLSHLPLLRHPGRRRHLQRHQTEKLGQLLLCPFYHAHLGPQPPCDAIGTMAPAHHAQIQLFSRQVQREQLQRMRPMLTPVPG